MNIYAWGKKYGLLVCMVTAKISGSIFNLEIYVGVGGKKITASYFHTFIAF